MPATQQRSDDDPFAKSPVLGVLPPDDRKRLTERCVERRFDKGQIVFVEGQTADTVLALMEGRLKVSTFSTDGAERFISSVAPGEILGEIGVLSAGPRSATVTATAPSRALVLSRTVIMELIEQRPAIAVAMLRLLADMVRRNTVAASDLVFLDLGQRVAKFLVDRSGGSPTDIRITQTDLAAAVGASRQRVNGSLQEFQRQGWISLASRTVRVLDPEALELASRG